MDSNRSWKYTTVAIILHWLIALFVIGLIALGWYMISIEDRANSYLYFTAHKSLGIITGILIFYRLTWRLTHKPAPLPANVVRWQAVLARAIHWLLYLCMILMPLTGFFGAAYGKHGVSFFGLQLPRWVVQNNMISHQLFNIHGMVVWVLVGLIGLHVLAALKHLLINKDQVFQRILL